MGGKEGGKKRGRKGGRRIKILRTPQVDRSSVGW